jgi:hypothetical protein
MTRAQLIEFTPTAGHRIAERRVVEHRLDQVLAVVERALDRDGVDVGLIDRGHLPTLHLAGAVVG